MRNSISRATRIAFVAAVLSLSSPLHAQEATAEAEEPSDEAEARALFEAGRVAFHNGQLERALEYFTQSYQLSVRPALLFNMGSVQDRLGLAEEALDSYRRYVEVAPDAEGATFARRRVEALTERLARQRDEADDSGADDVPAILALSAGGVFAAASVATLVVWLERDERVGECNALGCTNGATIVSERDVAMGLTIAFGAASLAGLATGLALLLTGGSSSNDTAVRCAPGWGSLACAGRF